MDQHDRILLFDGVCNLCNRLVIFVINKDKKEKIRFGQLQSSIGQSILLSYGIRETHIDSLVYIEDKIIYLKSSAVLHLLKSLGGGWNLFYGFIVIPAFVRDFIYDLVARYRFRVFGKRDICHVPSDDKKARFLM